MKSLKSLKHKIYICFSSERSVHLLADIRNAMASKSKYEILCIFMLKNALTPVNCLMSGMININAQIFNNSFFLYDVILKYLDIQTIIQNARNLQFELLLAESLKIAPNSRKTTEISVNRNFVDDRNCRNGPKFRENVCFRNFRNYAKFREKFDRN